MARALSQPTRICTLAETDAALSRHTCLKAIGVYAARDQWDRRPVECCDHYPGCDADCEGDRDHDVPVRSGLLPDLDREGAVMPPMLFKERLEQLRSIVASWTDDELSAARAGVEEELRAIDVEQGRRWQPNQPSPRK